MIPRSIKEPSSCGLLYWITIYDYSRFDIVHNVERKLETIDFEKNRSAFEKHKVLYESSEQTLKDFYLIEVQKALNFEVGKFLYEECW